jgi:benzil reductase ((S)-benzoin forming)
MKNFIITGTSRGLGHAIARKILEDRNARVVGISRSSTILHDHYRHVHLDLSDIGKLQRQCEEIFQDINGAEQAILINNAGSLGQVAYLGNLENENIHKAININLIAPAILTNEFIKKYKTRPIHKTVVSISSGAGKHAVDGWSIYCMSKAGLDMLAQVGAKEANIHHTDIKHFAISPGIVDTDMQHDIRNVSKDDFSRVEEFIEYKKENMLLSPEKMAEKFLHFLEEESIHKSPIVSVREL